MKRPSLETFRVGMSMEKFKGITPEGERRYMELLKDREVVREEASNSSLQEQLLQIEKTKIESLVS